MTKRNLTELKKIIESGLEGPSEEANILETFLRCDLLKLWTESTQRRTEVQIYKV